MQLEPLEWQGLIAGWRATRLPAFLSGWHFQNLDALSFLRDCVATRDPERGLGAFNAGFSSSILDRLIADHGAIREAKKRREHYRQIMAQARDEMPLVPLLNPQVFYGLSESLEWRPRVDGKVLAAEMVWR